MCSFIKCERTIEKTRNFQEILLNTKSGVWNASALEILKVRIKAKFELTDISSTTRATVSKQCISLRLDFSNIFSETAVWTENGLEMLKVRKRAKFDFNLCVDISQT